MASWPSLRRDVRWQSQEIDPQKRLALVWQIQKKLEKEAARPTMGWRTDRFAHWPHVKNLIPHNVTYNWARHQETWLGKIQRHEVEAWLRQRPAAPGERQERLGA